MKTCKNASRRTFFANLVRSSLAVRALLAKPSAAQRTSSTGRLDLSVFDKKSSKGMPARLHLQLESGLPWTPLARPAGHHHGDAVPPLLTGHDFQPGIAPQRTSVLSTHLSNGQVVLELPAGRHRLYVSRGFEYRPVHLDVTIRNNRTTRQELALEQWVDMPAQGYFSGDIHQHFTRTDPQENLYWEALARAEDLHVINTMVLKHGEPTNRYSQYAYGREGTHQNGHYVIVPGQEFRDNDMSGHVSMAGIQQIIEPVSTGKLLGLRENYPPFAVACREARRQGAIVGWAHGAVSGSWGGCKGMESVAVEAALGLIDFIEVVQFMSFFGQTFWYRLLGSGMNVAGAGGTDFPFGIWLAPWYPSFGQERTYVKVNPNFVNRDFGANAWFDGIRRGEVFASNGPMLWFNVEGRPSGATLRLGGSRKVRVEATARCAYPLDAMEIVINGRVMEEVFPATRSKELIQLDREFIIDQSSWIAVRVRGTVEKETFGGARYWPLFAHSGPVFALLAGQPVRIVPDLEFLLDYTQRFREFVVKNGVFDSSEHKDIFLANIDEAVAIYRQRLQGR
jgi:hypothetical protein